MKRFSHKAASELFDPSVLAGLTDNDERVFAAVVSSFLAQCPSLLHALAVASHAGDAGDAAQAAFQAHAIKGMARNIGSASLFSLARNAEALAREGAPTEQLVAAAAALQDEFGRLSLLLQEYTGS